MAASDDRIRLLVETYGDQQASLVVALLRLLLGLWGPFQWWNRPDMVNAYAAMSTVHVDSAISRARRIARAYVIEQLRALDVLPDQLPPVSDSYERGGTSIVEVYKRPARQREHTIRLEKPSTEQRDAFVNRLKEIIEADLAAVARDEAQKVFAASPAVIGYRRVIHPELSRTGTCGLCVVAASRFYTVDDLLPIHDRCKCTVAPVTKTSDPGLRLNREDLDALYRAAGSTFAEQLKQTRISIKTHGELGPVLVRRGQHFRNLAEVNRDASRMRFTAYERMNAESNTAMWRGMRSTSERSLRILLEARRDGSNLLDMGDTGRRVPVADIDVAINHHRALIARAARYGA